MPKNQPVTENEMVVTDKGFLLVPVDRPHWIFRGRIGSKKVRPICGDLLWYIDSIVSLVEKHALCVLFFGYH